MASFAVMLRSRAGHIDGILMIVDDHRAAEAIAMEMRANGHDVDVEEIRDRANTADLSWPRSARLPSRSAGDVAVVKVNGAVPR